MMTSFRPIGLLCAGLAAMLLGAGCSGSSSSDSALLNGSDPTTLSLTAQTPNGLTATLAQDNSTIPVTTGTVNYVLTLTNNSPSAVTVAHPDDAKGNPLPPVTFTLVDASGSTVYQLPSSGTLTSLVLQPKGYLSETLTLPGALRVIGRYQATAVFTTDGTTTVGPLTITAR